MEFKDFIKEAREKQALTQETAASLINVTISTVQNWENDRAKPGSDLLLGIAKAYKITIEDLLKAINSVEYEEYIDDFNYDYFKFAHLLPTDLDYDNIKCLTFTREQQNLFLIFAINLKFSDNPVNSMLTYNKDLFTTVKALDRFYKLGLYKINNLYFQDSYSRSHDGTIFTQKIQLSASGEFLHKWILANNNKLFNVYELNIIDFIGLLKAFNIYNCSVDLIRNIVLEPIILTEIKHYNDCNYDESRKDKNSYSYYYNKFVLIKNNVINSDVSNCYYDILKEELQDARYINDKESYNLKLNFYQENKDKLDRPHDYIPQKFIRWYNKKAVPTPKAIDLINEIDSINN